MLHVEIDAFELMSERTKLTTVSDRCEAFREHCANLHATLRNIEATQFPIVLDFNLRDALRLLATLHVKR